MNSFPLEGVKVLDFSLLLPGPLCSMYLADMGAEVIKVENPRAKDGTRMMFQSDNGLSPLFQILNRNKKAITLNIKKKESKEIVFKLLSNTDVLLEGFRPDAMDELGIGYESLKKQFPRLIYCGISGYGSNGKWKDFAGHDGNYLALSGLLGLSGSKFRPYLSGYQLADVGGGTLTALSAILAALYGREKTGKGMKIDISMMESSLQFLSLYIGIYMSTGKIPEKENELLNGKLPNYNIYEIKNNRFVMLGTLEERFFSAFLRQSGIKENLNELPLIEINYQKWKEILEKYFIDQTIDSLQDHFNNTECCLTLIRNLEEVLNDEHFLKTGLIQKLFHPKYGESTLLSSPFSFLRNNKLKFHPPEHGEHTGEILHQIGYTLDEINRFRLGRVI
jgi:alpha-methylacyl-CoA racemase